MEQTNFCFTINVIESFEVDNRHPATIRVYEYYSLSSMTIQNFDINHIEDITTENPIEETTTELNTDGETPATLFTTTETNTLITTDTTQTITDITTDSINTEANIDSTDIYPSELVQLN